MDPYSIALFVHIVGALLLFVLLTIEGVGLRAGFATAQVNRILGPISALAILIPGIYMVATQVGWKPWIAVSITSWVLIAAGGAYTGISLMRGRMATRTATISWLVRIGMALGVVFDMTVKPDAIVAVIAILAGVVTGAAVGLATRREVCST
ncbi:MAG: hypothetical protein E6J53_08900 [Chloroflexi bacterium]|nr:MAG: hypothetical protein E6J53_08900 [Chloroflexota bacterium]